MTECGWIFTEDTRWCIYIRKKRNHFCVEREKRIVQSFLYEVEAGKKGCSVYVLHRLAISLGVTVNYFLQDESQYMLSESEAIYKKLREEQQEKVDSFARMLYELLKALGE